MSLECSLPLFMSLRRKILILLTAVFVLYLVVLLGIVRFLVLPVLHEGEQELARVDANRVVSILAGELGELEFLANEATFNRGLNQGRGERDNLSMALRGFQVDFAAVFIGDQLSEARFPAARPMFETFDPREIAWEVVAGEEVGGLHATSAGPLLVGSAISGETSDGDPIRLLFGRFLDPFGRDELVARIRVRFRLHQFGEWHPPNANHRIPTQIITPFQFHRIDGEEPPVELKNLFLQEGNYPIDFYRTPVQHDVLKIVTYYPGPEGKPAWVLVVERNRVFMMRIARGATVVLASMVALGLLLMLLILGFLSRSVLRPVDVLRHHLSSIERPEDLPTRINERMEGELGRLAKDFNMMLERLEKENAARTRAQMECQRSEEKYRHLANHDDLTGLYNQRHMYQALKDLFRENGEERKPVSLIFIDIDKFKSVVDTHGHLNGSRAIAEVAATISSSLPDDGSFAVSYGGDEYVVVLPGYIKQQALEKAEEIRIRMARSTYLESEGLNIKLTASFGVANFPEDCEDMQGLLSLADKALFYIKSMGKNGVGESRGRMTSESVSIDMSEL